MAYYYVKSGGTATGDGGRETTARTGTWSSTASEYYDSIVDAVGATTAPAVDDYIYCSDLHTKTTTGASITVLAHIISVDDTSQDEYKPGADEYINNAASEFLMGSPRQLVAGTSIGGQDNSITLASTTSYTRFVDMDILTSQGGDTMLAVNAVDGTSIDLINVRLHQYSSTTGIYAFTLSNGCSLRWYGGSTVEDTGGINTLISNSAGTNGGMTAEIVGVDLSLVGSYIWLTNTEGNLDSCKVTLRNCTLASGVTLHGTLYSGNQIFEMYNCDDTTGASIHRFYYATGSGAAQNNDSIYITSNPGYLKSTDKFSFAVTTTTYCSHAQPFVFEIPARYVDLSQAASDKVIINLTSSLTLTDTEIAAFLVYPDGTTAVQPNWVTSGKTVGTGNYGIDPLAAGTTLTTGDFGSGDWTGGLTNYYKLEMDTSTDAGQAAFLSVRIEVYKASITSGQLYIDPIIRAA